MASRSRDDRQLTLFEASPPDAAANEAAEPASSLAGRDEAPAPPPPDAADRDYAVSPLNNVVLEASAGTGKTTVLVQRYLNLLGAGVDPAHILAMTFTRKAAAEMRQRIVGELRKGALRSEEGRRRWLRVRDRVGDIAISTIDAFCLSLLREFPLEAGLDPSFQVADETEVARLVERTLDETLRVARGRARQQPDLAFVLTQLTPRQLRDGLRHLLDRRAVAMPALAGYLARADAPPTAGEAVRRATTAVLEAIEQCVGLAAWIDHGPLGSPSFAVLAQDVRRVHARAPGDDAAWRVAFERLRDDFLTQKGEPRRQLPYPQRDFGGKADVEMHRRALAELGPRVATIADRLDAQVNAVLARGILQLARIAESAYARAMDVEDVLDFTETLRRAVGLLRQMDEFSRSRFRLESRYHHVLVDEFQDTNRLQWELVSLLIEAWGAGEGLVGDPLPPTVFVVGDRKQSIYRFRDAEVALLDEAARHVARLRPGDRPRKSIATSFRSAPALLAFVNDLFADLEKAPARSDAFRYDDTDRFPLPVAPAGDAGPVLGVAGAASAQALADTVAEEVVRLVRTGQTVRDRETGVARAVRPGDIAVLFRTRDSHREYERALDAHGVPTYVYKGLGFFDADEVQDLSALVRYLAEPTSRLREAALLRSRLFRLSDAALLALSGDLGRVLRVRRSPAVAASLEPDDRARLELAREAMARWVPLVDRVPPADLVDRIVVETAFARELRGPRLDQARENVKKFRGLVRRIQNRGYATMARIAEHLDRLSVGDESNAAIDAVNAVNLMTVHASKGLEFPVVFLVNLAKGTGGGGGAIRVVAEDGRGEPAVSIGTLRFEADEEEKLRDREETKRLLYVALTRARDRLYLATALTPDLRFRPMAGSLGEVFPPSLSAVFEEAARASTPTVAWRAGSDAVHQFLRCAARVESALAPAPDEAAAIDLLGPVDAAPSLAVSSVRAIAQPPPAPTGRRAWDVTNTEGVITGRIVHRLFQLVDPSEAATVSDAALEAHARSSLRVEEREALDDEGAAVAAACRTWRALAGRAARERWLDGERFYEVPFTLLLEPREGEDRPRAARGVIDCIVVRAPEEVRVVEIKAGRRAEWHAGQLDLYVRAARSLFPGARVSGVLLTPEDEPGPPS
jgi:ATP-dependent helicase/nuclease subunit A